MFPRELTNQYSEATKFLTNAISKNKLANSYIFIGKDLNDISLLVTNLAKILNCEQNKNKYTDACNACINCKWLDKNEHPQALTVINIDLKSKKEQIKIDTIRELLNTLKITSDYFRIIFFQYSSINYLPAESCNLLLKTVEETPERIVFIFANSTKNDILPTILSRSQIVYINKKYNTNPHNEVYHFSAPSGQIFLSEERAEEKFSSAERQEKCETILADWYKMPENAKTFPEKIKNIQEYMDKNDIDLKEYLLNLATVNYDSNKYTNPIKFCFLYENITNAYLKYKSFMQPKIVLEDLFISHLQAKTV